MCVCLFDTKGSDGDLSSCVFFDFLSSSLFDRCLPTPISTGDFYWLGIPFYARNLCFLEQHRRPKLSIALKPISIIRTKDAKTRDGDGHLCGRMMWMANKGCLNQA